MSRRVSPEGMGAGPDDPIGQELEVRALASAASHKDLAQATLPELLLHGLAYDVDGSEAVHWTLHDLHRDLAAFAALAVAAVGADADLVLLGRDIGPMLQGFVRRLEVSIELHKRIESGRRARRARQQERRAAKGAAR